MKLSLLVAYFCGYLCMCGAVVIPSNAVSVFTKEKKPVVAQLFEDQTKSVFYNGNNHNNKPYHINDNKFSWYKGQYSHDYIPGETTGLLLSEKVLLNNTLQLLNLESNYERLPWWNIVVPAHTETIWKYEAMTGKDPANRYALYLPVKYLQHLGVSSIHVGKFVAACDGELAYALGSPLGPNLEQDTPLLLGVLDTNNVVVGGRVESGVNRGSNSSGKKLSVRDLPFSFGGTNLDGTPPLQSTDIAIQRETEPQANHNAPFANSTLCKEQTPVLKSTRPMDLFRKKNAEAVSFSFER